MKLKLTALILLLKLTGSYADVISRFNDIKQDPNALYAFFKAMPKGGELHYHLAGGPYAETMLKLAESGNYCIDTNTYIMAPSTTPCKNISAKDLPKDQKQYIQTIQAWSMSHYVPGPESKHDHFFNSFQKFLNLVVDFRPELLADVMKRAADQHEHYLEIMDLPDNAASAGFGDLLKNTSYLDDKRTLLLKNTAFQDNIAKTVRESSHLLQKTRALLDCNSPSAPAACQVKITFLYYVLREQPLDNVFAQALNGFEAISRSKGELVGINLVQPENGYISLRDYRAQMKIFNYLHQKYPNVHISLHAGELSHANATPEDLGFHVHDAVLTAHAERIGHGVDIAAENDLHTTLDHMLKHQVAVEINLISNKEILNVSGKEHPLKFYLSNNIPVVLSTDDEGILRTDLTQQYVEAALVQGLDYPAIKQINRNALSYAFLPGASIWTDNQKAEIRSECKDLNSASCKTFVETSEKAKLQWQLEQQLKDFEMTF